MHTVYYLQTSFELGAYCVFLVLILVRHARYEFFFFNRVCVCVCVCSFCFICVLLVVTARILRSLVSPLARSLAVYLCRRT